MASVGGGSRRSIEVSNLGRFEEPVNQGRGEGGGERGRGGVKEVKRVRYAR